MTRLNDLGGAVAGTSFLEYRRRLRRLRMIVELTSDLLRDSDQLSPREARCLVECARKSIAELLPGHDLYFEQILRPAFERMIIERWPVDRRAHYPSHELVN